MNWYFWLGTPHWHPKEFDLSDWLLDHVGLPHVLVLVVHLVNLLVWMGKVNHSETFLILAFFCWSTPSWLKVVGGVVGWDGGPCDYCVGPSPNNCFFGFYRLSYLSQFNSKFNIQDEFWNLEIKSVHLAPRFMGLNALLKSPPNDMTKFIVSWLYIQLSQCYIQLGQCYIQLGQCYIWPGWCYIRLGQCYIWLGQCYIRLGQCYIQLTFNLNLTHPDPVLFEWVKILNFCKSLLQALDMCFWKWINKICDSLASRGATDQDPFWRAWER